MEHLTGHTTPNHISCSTCVAAAVVESCIGTARRVSGNNGSIHYRGNGLVQSRLARTQRKHAHGQLM